MGKGGRGARESLATPRDLRDLRDSSLGRPGVGNEEGAESEGAPGWGGREGGTGGSTELGQEESEGKAVASGF